MPRAMARVCRRAPPRPLDTSRRPLALAHLARSRDGDREQAPPPQLRRRLARRRRSLRRSRMLQRASLSAPRPPTRTHASSHATISRSSTAPPWRSAAPSTRTPPPARSLSTTWISAISSPPRHGPPRASAPTSTTAATLSRSVRCLALAIPHLADDAVVIIDDTNKRAARSANNLVARALQSFKLILDLRTPRNHSPTWWNGIQVYRYQRRQPTPQQSSPTQASRSENWFTTTSSWK